MLLQELVDVIETLRGRIQTHRLLLAQSEAVTRYALIDPFLRVLGWDTEDPAVVRPEYTSPFGRADYMLMGNAAPLAAIEAKKLGESITTPIIAQAITYCLQEGTQYFVITDGQYWSLYETHKPVPIEQKQLVQFDLVKNTVPEIAIAALAMWRSNFGASVPKTFLASSGSNEPPTTSPALIPPQPAQPAGHESSWIPLTLLTAEHLKRPPTSVRGPDGAPRPVKYWADVLREVARMLYASGKLADALPMPAGPGSRDRFLLSNVPKHPSGRDFFNMTQIGPGVFLESNYHSQQFGNQLRFLLQRVNEDPSRYLVQVAT